MPAKPRRESSLSPVTVPSILASLKSLADKKTRHEMSSRYGIHTKKAFGIPMNKMLKLAKEIGRDHDLALALWKTGWYEARMVACMVDEPGRVTSKQMDQWCGDFDNWGICDTVCFKLFDQVPGALDKVAKWARSKEEFVKRGGFALLACVALHNKTLADEPFLKLLPVVEKGAADERNFVKKGVSWALRGMAMRSPVLRAEVLALSEQLAVSDEPAKRWVGKDVLRQVNKRR